MPTPLWQTVPIPADLTAPTPLSAYRSHLQQTCVFSGELRGIRCTIRCRIQPAPLVEAIPWAARGTSLHAAGRRRIVIVPQAVAAVETVRIVVPKALRQCGALLQLSARRPRRLLAECC